MRFRVKKHKRKIKSGSTIVQEHAREKKKKKQLKASEAGKIIYGSLPKQKREDYRKRYRRFLEEQERKKKQMEQVS